MTDNVPVRRQGVSAETYDPSVDEELINEAHKCYQKTEVQRNKLSENVKNILIFRNLSQQDLDLTLDAMFEKKVNKGEVVIKEGDDQDYFYVIEDGIFEVIKTVSNGSKSKVLTYNNSGFFGELALMYNQPRAATIIAATDGVLWCMDRQTFRRIVVNGAFKKRKIYEDLINKVKILSALPEYDCMKITDALVSRKYCSGDRIIKQGDPADGLYFIEMGNVICKVSPGEGEEEKIVNRLSQGDYFGELAILFDKPRVASVYAESDCVCAFLEVSAFERLLGPYSSIMSSKFEDYHDQLKKIVGMDFDFADLR